MQNQFILNCFFFIKDESLEQPRLCREKQTLHGRMAHRFQNETSEKVSEPAGQGIHCECEDQGWGNCGLLQRQR